MDLPFLVLLAIACVVIAILVGLLFSHPRTRPVMRAVGHLLEFLASILR